LPKAIEAYQLWTQAYPHDAGAWGNLGMLYGASGQYEKSIVETQEAIRLEPNSGTNYSNLLLAQAALDRFDDARNTFNLEIVKKIEDPILRVNWFGVAFVLGDTEEMDKQMAWSAAKPQGDTLMINYWLPVIRASAEIARNNPRKAIQLLQPTAPYELASSVAWSGLGGPTYPAYLRGAAYLQLHQGSDAAAEYQKIIDHPGFMLACPLGAL